MTAVTMPIGTHPRDRSMPAHLAVNEGSPPVPHDSTERQWRSGQAPWSVDNDQALGVFQRLADTAATGIRVVDANQSGTVKIVGRQRGRTRLTLWVPATYPAGGAMVSTPAGVMIAMDESDLFNGGGMPLNIGDSVDIPAECAVLAALQPGQTTGVVAYVHSWNPAGGGLDL